MLKACFSSSLTLGSLGVDTLTLPTLAPKSAAADLSNGVRLPIRLRHTKTAPQGGRFGMAEPEGFEPSIGLYNPITV